ncbi:hypothetical protein ACYJ1Y_04465 [Natrialbaceae archaeon A-gly3]
MRLRTRTAFSQMVGVTTRGSLSPAGTAKHLPTVADTLVTPHTGWYSEGSRRQLSREIVDDVGRVLAGEEPENDVLQGGGDGENDCRLLLFAHADDL